MFQNDPCAFCPIGGWWNALPNSTQVLWPSWRWPSCPCPDSSCVAASCTWLTDRNNTMPYFPHWHILQSEIIEVSKFGLISALFLNLKGWKRKYGCCKASGIWVCPKIWYTIWRRRSQSTIKLGVCPSPSLVNRKPSHTKSHTVFIKGLQPKDVSQRPQHVLRHKSRHLHEICWTEAMALQQSGFQGAFSKRMGNRGQAESGQLALHNSGTSQSGWCLWGWPLLASARSAMLWMDPVTFRLVRSLSGCYTWYCTWCLWHKVYFVEDEHICTCNLPKTP